MMNRAWFALIFGTIAIGAQAQVLTVRADSRVYLDSNSFDQNPQSDSIAPGFSTSVSSYISDYYVPDVAPYVTAHQVVGASLSGPNSGTVTYDDTTNLHLTASHFGGFEYGFGAPESLTTYDFSLAGAGILMLNQSYSINANNGAGQYAVYTLIDGAQYNVFSEGGSKVVNLGAGNHEIAFGDYSNGAASTSSEAFDLDAETQNTITFTIDGQVGAPTPEPTTLGCLGLGVLATLRRRRSSK